VVKKKGSDEAGDRLRVGSSFAMLVRAGCGPNVPLEI